MKGKRVANPGCLRAVYSHDDDGDPRYKIYDDTGRELETAYSWGLWKNRRIESKARRAMTKIAKRLNGNAAPEELVIDQAKYNQYLEEKAEA